MRTIGSVHTGQLPMAAPFERHAAKKLTRQDRRNVRTFLKPAQGACRCKLQVGHTGRRAYLALGANG